jgi:UDP-N-acetylglucosamine 2-epimerase
MQACFGGGHNVSKSGSWQPECKALDVTLNSKLVEEITRLPSTDPKVIDELQSATQPYSQHLVSHRVIESCASEKPGPSRKRKKYRRNA